MLRSIEKAEFFFSADTQREQKFHYDAYFSGDNKDVCDMHIIMRFNFQDMGRMQKRLIAAKEAMLEKYPNQMQTAICKRDLQLAEEKAEADLEAQQARARQAQIAAQAAEYRALQRAHEDQRRRELEASFRHNNNETEEAPTFRLFHAKPGGQLVKPDSSTLLPFDFRAIK